MSRIVAKETFIEVRIKSGESQNSLARLAKTTPGTISRIEANKTSVRPKLAKTIAQALGVNFDDIFSII